MQGADDREELRRRRKAYGPPPWSLRPPAPGIEKRFRRWNVVLIAILAFFVLGMFVLAKAPAPSMTAHSASSQHVHSKGALPKAHNHT